MHKHENKKDNSIVTQAQTEVGQESASWIQRGPKTRIELPQRIAGRVRRLLDGDLGLTRS